MNNSIASHVFIFLQAPLADVLEEKGGGRMIFTALHEGFFTQIKVGFFTALCVSFPIISIQIWKFIAPALYRNDGGNYYDYLAFFINGVEQDKWAGESDWSQSSFEVNAGEHEFKWIYHKDQGVTAGQDAVWIDKIIFPPCFGLSNSISGDLNNDEAVNVLDVVILVNYILEGNNNFNADINNDNSVNVLDVVLLINTILGR